MATGYGPPEEGEKLTSTTSSFALVPFTADVELPGESTQCYEPLCRFYHLMHTIGTKAYLYGGFFNKILPPTLSLELLSSTVHIFDPRERRWTSKIVDADVVPFGFCDAASTTLDGILYTYGGSDINGKPTNHLYKLDIESMEWNQLVPLNPEDGPMPKVGCGMIAFGGNLGIFGGCGINLDELADHGKIHDLACIDGRTNEFHLFDTSTDCWFPLPPNQECAPPPACSHFTLTQIDREYAIFFGGYSQQHSYMNTVYIMNFLTMHWTMVPPIEGALWPEGRYSHASCCLSHNGLSPHLLVTGGQASQNRVLSYAWLFNIKRRVWRKLPVKSEARRGHSLTAITIGPSMIEVITFGGSPESWTGNHEEGQLMIARTRSFVFELSDNEWELISEAYLPNFSDEKRYTALNRRINDSPSRQANSTEILLDALQLQIHLSEIKALDYSESAQNAEGLLQEEQQRFREFEVDSKQRIQDIEEQVSQLEARLHEMREMVKHEQYNVHRAELRVLEEKERALAQEERVDQLEISKERLLRNLQQSKTNVSSMEAKIDELTKSIEETDSETSISSLTQAGVDDQQQIIENLRADARKRVMAANKRTALAEERIKNARERINDAKKRTERAEQRLKLTEKQTTKALEEANARVHSIELEAEQRVRKSEEYQKRIQNYHDQTSRDVKLIQETDIRIQELEAERSTFEERQLRTNERVMEQQSRAERAERTIDELRTLLAIIELGEEERRTLHEQTIAQEQKGLAWEVNPENIQISDEVLGVGGWGEVRVATLTVAAKQLHPNLAYAHHHQLFRREMCMAARVSHPNLLRFMGARLDGGMTIITERMPTSLRTLIDRGHTNGDNHLPHELIISISVDVTCALNYLHLMTPDPMIHRDLSSANVLLQQTPDGGWLAKISDYGTVNFQQLVHTENPGSVVYAAPEARNPALQTPKMDIYSFGVLLVEMCTCEFPAPEHHAELIESIVSYPRLVAMIMQCLKVNKDERPTAAQLVTLLKAMQ